MAHPTQILQYQFPECHRHDAYARIARLARFTLNQSVRLAKPLINTLYNGP